MFMMVLNLKSECIMIRDIYHACMDLLFIHTRSTSDKQLLMHMEMNECATYEVHQRVRR